VNERRVGGTPNPWRTLSPDSVPAHESLPLCHLTRLPPTGTLMAGLGGRRLRADPLTVCTIRVVAADPVEAPCDRSEPRM
jgi:hypothetical protein